MTFSIRVRSQGTNPDNITNIKDQKEYWFNRAKMARGSRNWPKGKVNAIVEAWEKLGDDPIELQFDSGHAERVSIRVFLGFYFGMPEEATPQDTENTPATAEESVPF